MSQKFFKRYLLLLEEELEAEGYAVVGVGNGAGALAAMRHQMPDLAVLDLGMPGMDGIDLLGKLLALNNSLPIVIYTGYPSYRDNFMCWAADAYLMKRGDLGELKETIRGLLDGKLGTPAQREEVAPTP